MSARARVQQAHRAERHKVCQKPAGRPRLLMRGALGRHMGLIERELARKLLAEHHLSVPERRLLPEDRIRFSDLVAAVDEGLAESGWFPHPLRPDHAIGEGALIETRQGELWVHEQHEVGVGRFGPIRSYQVADLAAAVRAYVEAESDPTAPLDGVTVDWEA